MSIDVRAKQYGKVFGDWQFDKLVGSGSGGKTAVFRLKRPHSNWEEISALKVVSIIEENGQLEQYSTFFKIDYENRKSELCQKAEEEVRIMYRMHGSAYVVNYFDYIFHDWEEENRFGCDLLIRMEFLKNLREQIKQGITYTETEVIQIGKDICKALIGCHKENIIHRDIKPENIFQNSQGDYKLGDFGISRMVSRSKSASTMTGTQAYAAPEQFAQNGASNYDYRVDIYSLGLILYELCNENRLPFAKSNYVREEEIQLRIMGKTLEKPCNASLMLSEVILKACAYKPENRYQSAQEFLDALVVAENNEKRKDEKKNCKEADILYATMLADAAAKVEIVENQIKSETRKKKFISNIQDVIGKFQNNILEISGYKRKNGEAEDKKNQNEVKVGLYKVSLLHEWRKIAYDNKANKRKLQQFWRRYFLLEQGIYEKLLANPDQIVEGTVKELADKYQVTILEMVGFLDGINDSLLIPNPIEKIQEDTYVSLAFDKKELYKNMVRANAEWLYRLSVWDNVLDREIRKNIYLEEKNNLKRIRGKQ